MLEPDLVGQYLRRGLRIDEVIAHGSFGTVYRASQLDVDRAVAVKVLHAEFDAEDEVGQMFRDEIRAIGRIDHRNVVRVFDADLTREGRLYFVMELLEGKTLEQIGAAGTLQTLRAVGLVRQLLEGLVAVHAAGRIHADIKPANAIVVDDEGAERVVLIDFGLSRRRAPELAEAVGGTRPFMAPEQLHAWKLDARSDVFAAALVLVWLLLGWRRGSADELVPSVDAVEDPALRIALSRALALDVAERISARDFIRALTGGIQDEPLAAAPPPPFRHLAPLTEGDRYRLHGRESDVVRVARHVDQSRAVVLTGPTGVGKTSLLRAGLMPYFDAQGVRAAYVDCVDPAALSALDAALAGPPPDGAEGSSHARAQRVAIVDQVEAILGGIAPMHRLVSLAEPRLRDPQLALVFGVREDFLARLLDAVPQLRAAAQIRLHPLDPAGARAAIVAPLGEHGITMAADLLETMIDDLRTAGRELGPEFGAKDTIYPPHLQLTCAALYSALRGREATITLEHYRRLGGFAAIVGDYLERRLGELSDVDRVTAREIFASLVAAPGVRAVRSEDELIEATRRIGEPQTHKMLERLHSTGLIARRVAGEGSPTWELIHDSLVPRVERWLEIQNLDRRRAAELLRFHLRRSAVRGPSLLRQTELRELARFPTLLDELEAEWARRLGVVWTPKRLVDRSQQTVRRRRALVLGGMLALLAISAILVSRWLEERSAHLREAALRLAEATLRDRDLGRVVLELAPFDWDEARLVAVSVDAGNLGALRWTLRAPRDDDPAHAGNELPVERFKRGRSSLTRGLQVNELEVRGGDAFLEVDGRGVNGESCPPSIVVLRRLPGYARRKDPPRRLRIRVPTCQASRAGTIAIAAGRFVSGGRGSPPSSFPVSALVPEAHPEIAAFRIDRTEVINAAFAVFGEMSAVHGSWASSYPEALAFANGGSYPRSDVDWTDARAYCWFMGKELPSSMQWQRALRGPADAANPLPERNLPWGAPVRPVAAAIATTRASRPTPAGSHPLDRSPDGVLDLAGSLQEWTLDPERGADATPLAQRARITRGGNWFDTSPETLIDYMAIENARNPRLRNFFIGFRCVTQT